MLTLRPRDEVRWDLVALGEVMLRLDPGDRRIHTTRHFDVWEGGGEYNVARGLRRAFGLRTALVSALVDNPVGRPPERPILLNKMSPSCLGLPGLSGSPASTWISSSSAAARVANSWLNAANTLRSIEIPRRSMRTRTESSGRSSVS